MILSIQNARKIYGMKKAIDGISFAVDEGEIIGYLGPNGSGKTTTIKAIVNQIELSGGTVKVFDYDVKNDFTRCYGMVGAIFEKNGLYERLSGKENIDLYLSACGVKLDKAQYDSLVERLDLTDGIDKPVNTYSKGMKRKLALLRCLLANHKLLLLDEPFDGIDIECRADIVKLIKEFNKTNKTTIILTSHVMADIEDLASRIIVIKKGNILCDESMVEFNHREGNNLTEKYLEAISDEKQELA